MADYGVIEPDTSCRDIETFYTPAAIAGIIPMITD